MTTPSPDQIQTQALEYMKQGQEAMTTMVAALSENLAGMMRGVTGGGNAPGIAGAMPRPVDAIDQAYDLAIQMIEAQRSFAHSILDASAPALKAAESVVDSTVDRARTR